MQWGVSKAVGIQDILTKAHLTKVPTYAFGDQLNDIEMFRMIQTPIAMGNGHPQVKQLARYVTADNMHGGIAQGLQHFDLIWELTASLIIISFQWAVQLVRLATGLNKTNRIW